MIEILAQIPSSFWGVLVGGFFPIIGVVLTNKANERRLLAQFEHERNQKSIEREMTLKKEVYLLTAEAVSAGISVIGSFSNFEIHDDAIVKPYSDKSFVIAKVHVIGNLEVIRALNAFTSELSSIFLILFAERAKISKSKIERDIVLKNIEYYSKLREGTLEMMKQCNLEPVKDIHKWNTLQSNYQFEAGYIDKAILEHGILNKNFAQRQLSFMKTCIEYSQQMSALVPALLHAVRQELELPLDELAYQEVIQQGINKQQASLNKFVLELSDYL